MTGVPAMIEQILVAALVGEKTLFPRKSRTDWAFTALSVLLGGAGVFLAVLGLDRFLEGLYPPDMAALGAAAIVFAAAALAAVAATHGRRRKAAASGAARDEVGRNIRALIESVCAELEGPVRDSPKTAVLLAALTGFFSAQQKH
jgi:hypothetical protein